MIHHDQVYPRARLSAVRCVIAVCAYRAKHGRLPGRLEDLAPEFLPAVPTDPFDTQAPVGYNPDTPAGPMVYVVGRDRKDDRALKYALYEDGGDWTFAIPGVNETWRQYQRRSMTWLINNGPPPATQPTQPKRTAP